MAVLTEAVQIAMEMAVVWKHHNSAGKVFKMLLESYNVMWIGDWERDFMITAASVLVAAKREENMRKEEAICQSVSDVLEGTGNTKAVSAWLAEKGNDEPLITFED